MEPWLENREKSSGICTMSPRWFEIGQKKSQYSISIGPSINSTCDLNWTFFSPILCKIIYTVRQLILLYATLNLTYKLIRRLSDWNVVLGLIKLARILLFLSKRVKNVIFTLIWCLAIPKTTYESERKVTSEIERTAEKIQMSDSVIHSRLS